ncbi:hypothetical protein SKAU_G00053790 [Synaphobranchus kaupii]|uniref:Uncharacterized protein n=1 Tax=Synaphobranchus kaupii TaxID=118154 RepID=A0A9Q1G4J7_SYNKA|nr:hypothetical protein SKAU_G00053790 [Synaphobranchus kaupii]
MLESRPATKSRKKKTSARLKCRAIFKHRSGGWDVCIDVTSALRLSNNKETRTMSLAPVPCALWPGRVGGGKKCGFTAGRKQLDDKRGQIPRANGRLLQSRTVLGRAGLRAPGGSHLVEGVMGETRSGMTKAGRREQRDERARVRRCVCIRCVFHALPRARTFK